MRKYYVTLLSIDRCLSQSIDEVISQLGTRISGWLGDEDDVHAMLSGLSECEVPPRHAAASAAQGGSAPTGLGRTDAAASEVETL